ncbi:MAG: DUF2231 domain-containing protein [Fidelibacterota bacterium]
MSLPEYIPNIHPLLVHFPIVFFCMAVLLHVLKIIFDKDNRYSRLVFWGYFLTSILLVFTYLSGRNAADHVLIPDDALSAVSSHADKALYLMIFSLILAGISGWMYYRKLFRLKILDIALAVMGIGGLGLLVITADAGGRLVFAYGVGVKTTPVSQPDKVIEKPVANPSELKIEDDGSWKWNSGELVSGNLLDLSEWIVGSQTDLSLQVDPSGKTLLIIDPPLKELLFSLGPPIEHVKVDIDIDLSKFIGEFRLIHHLQSDNSYDYLSISGKIISMGRNTRGKLNISESKQINSGIETLSVVGDGRHFRGYINDSVVVHGHKSPLGNGNIGIYINGSGTINIGSISAKNLKK